jgi:ATP-binding cassette subfamily B protein
MAIVGPSGSGKSTLLALVLGFLEPDQGKILLDGQDLHEFNLRDYRQHIGVVTQDLVLLADTVFENVAYGKPSASAEEVVEALVQAEAYDFVRNLPNGLYTKLGEDGVKLSGGQRQRLALARALVRNPKILVLDEATSALDFALEGKLQKTIRQLMQGRTTFIVSHRSPSTVACDQILVLSEGRIVACGRHEELLETSDFYAHFVNGVDSTSQAQH